MAEESIFEKAVSTLFSLGGYYKEIKVAESEAEIARYQYGAESVTDAESEQVRDLSGDDLSRGFAIDRNSLLTAGVLVLGGFLLYKVARS